MAHTFNRFENQIREYILDQMSDAHNRGAINFARYNNLKVSMSHQKEQRPHITVRLGISDATFLIADGSLLVGSLGADTKFIPKWINKNGIREELMATWQESMKVTAEEEKDNR